MSPIRLISKPKPKSKYGLGMHGAKLFEQKRLTDLYGRTVTGNKRKGPTHESEHPIGLEPINRTNTEKRGGGQRATEFERFALAYQEEYARHRYHIGTGNKGERDDSGMNSQEYRDSQRQLLLDNEPGIAVQLNQLGYGFDPHFKLQRRCAQIQSNDSFENMVNHVNQFKIANDSGKGKNKVVKNQPVNFKPGEIKEMLGSRAEALVKRHLNAMDISILQEVVEKRISYNSFLLAFRNGNYDKILNVIGMGDLKAHFYDQYDRLRNPEKYVDEDPQPTGDVDMESDQMDVD